MSKRFADRLAELERLEQTAAPYEGRPVTEWSDAELAAYLEQAYREWPRLRTMSDAELEALCNEEFQ